MTDRTLTVVPSTEGAPSAPPDVADPMAGQHPMERARCALRDAAAMETGPLRSTLLRLADELPPRGRG